MTRLAVAAPSPEAAEAAGEVARYGGNAVDAAIAAAAVAMVNEVGICAPGAGAFLTIAGADGDTITYDGYFAAPSAAATSSRGRAVEMEYGGGVTTLVGPASIAVPGAWAAFDSAHLDHGTLAWERLLQPAIALAERGFSLRPASRYYLGFSLDPIFSRDPASRRALMPQGRLVEEEDLVVVPGLAASLRLLAGEGAEQLYRGALAQRIGEDLQRRGSLLSSSDLAGYRTILRPPLRQRLGEWEIATNPPPAVGGVALAAILDLVGRGGKRMVEAQREIFRWRREEVDQTPERAGSIDGLLRRLLGSPSTVHVSAVDATGLACALTMSAGYGSGVIPEGTGLWMNNGLGEVELVAEDVPLRSGERLRSNMAPTVARSREGAVLAIGSPGADRITSALAQVLSAVAVDDLDLEAAVAKPRLHVELTDPVRVAAEPGAEVGDVELPVHWFDGPHMYFGGVGAAIRRSDGRLQAVADARRNGEAIVAG